MPPRPRRMSQRITDKSAPASQDPPADIEVVDPMGGEAAGTAPIDAGADAPVADSGRSARRGAAASRRNSVRGKAQSERAPRASKRAMTPEERAERKRTVKTVLLTLLLILLLGGAGVGAYFLLWFKPERVRVAEDTLTTANTDIRAIESYIANRQPAAAKTAYDHALAVLTGSAELGFAEQNPPQSDKLSSPKLAGFAYELRTQLQDQLKPRIERCERDLKAEENHRAMMTRFAAIPRLTDAELDALEKDAIKFMDNPVEPEAGAGNVQYAADYQLFVTEAKVAMPKIAGERKKRLEAITTVPARQAMQDAHRLVQDRRFKDALAAIDETKRKNPEADITKVREFVEQSAKLAWERSLHDAEEHYKTFQASGTTAEQRPIEIEQARKLMREVIEKFGMDEYVSQAQQKLQVYEAAK